MEHEDPLKKNGNMDNSYSCKIFFTNLKKLEDESNTNLIKAFASCFQLKQFKIQDYTVGRKKAFYAHIVFEHPSPIKRMHFAQCAISFALINGFPFSESCY